MKTCYETDRLLLQICTPDYCNEVLHFYKNNVSIFQPHDPLCPDNYYTSQYQYNALSVEYNAFLEKRGVRFYLFEKADPSRIIGTISFTNRTHSFLESAIVGYKLDKNYQHRGYAFEALQKGIEIMFFEERLHRLCAYIMPENEPSIRLIQRLYFTYEGIAREYALIQGKWEDHCQYSLIHHP